MKNIKWKKMVTILLAAILTLTVCGCGNSAGTVNNDGYSKQYVYSYQDIDLDIDTQNMGIYGMSYQNGRVYVLLEDYSGRFTPAVGARAAVTMESVTVESAVADVAVDGDFAVDLPMEEPVYYGPVYVLVSANLDGTDRTEVVLERPADSAENAYMNRIEIASDGSVVAMQEAYVEDLTDPQNPVFTTKNWLIKWNPDGTVQWKNDMQEYVGEVEYYYASKMFTTEEGTITFFSYEGLGANVDADGNLLSKIEFDSSVASTMGTIIRSKDGTIYVTSYNEEWTKMFISTFDINTGTMGEKSELPGVIQNYSFYPGYNTDFVLTNNSGVYTYNLGDETPVQIMDYINSDFPATYINGIVMTDETHLLGYYYDQTDYTQRFAYFTKVNPEDVPDKKTLVIGCNYLDYNIRKRVVDYNKSNSNYRIAIKDYSSYSTMEDYMAGYAQLNNDIISGQMPDILVVNANINISNYAEKGLLADIGKLIEEDEELSQKEFLTNVFDAVSVDGKLYTVVPSFSIQTMIGKTANLNGLTSWTMKEFMEISDSLPEGTSMFGPTMLRDSFIYQILNYLGNDFVDPQTGKCNFNSEEFIALLEYANTFPAEFSEDYWENYDYTLYENMYREDKAILMELYMSNISDLKYHIRGQFGEDVTFIGFPAAQGNGSVVEPSYLSLALSAKSKNLDGAWEFVRYYLTDEYQTSDELYDFPVSKEAFLAKAKKATERPYWIDENGEKVEYDETYWINNEEVILEPFTQEEVDKICEFIYSVTKTSDFKDEIRKIITEEAQYFFEGQKSAREVAGVIQSRAQVYMDEND